MPVISPHRSSGALSSTYRSTTYSSSLDRPSYRASSYGLSSRSSPGYSASSERYSSSTRSYTESDDGIYSRNTIRISEGLSSTLYGRSTKSPTRESSILRRESLIGSGNDSGSTVLQHRPSRISSLTVLDSVADMRNKYSPANYVPAVLRDPSRNREIGLPPKNKVTITTTTNTTTTTTNNKILPATNNTVTNGTVANGDDNNDEEDDVLSSTTTSNEDDDDDDDDVDDDNGNRGPSVSEMRKKFERHVAAAVPMAAKTSAAVTGSTATRRCIGAAASSHNTSATAKQQHNKSTAAAANKSGQLVVPVVGGGGGGARLLLNNNNSNNKKVVVVHNHRHHHNNGTSSSTSTPINHDASQSPPPPTAAIVSKRTTTTAAAATATKKEKQEVSGLVRGKNNASPPTENGDAKETAASAAVVVITVAAPESNTKNRKTIGTGSNNKDAVSTSSSPRLARSSLIGVSSSSSSPPAPRSGATAATTNGTTLMMALGGEREMSPIEHRQSAGAGAGAAAAANMRGASPPVKQMGLNGLKNIGNTCFMNSVIQCLSNTRPLLEYFKRDQHASDINTTISSMKGALIKAFAQVIKELWSEDASDRVVNTLALKSQIQRFAPRFMGYSQQDAQEFLRYLLEGLHEDVNRVLGKPTPITAEIDEKLSDGEKASESWHRYVRRENSKIVDLFVGQLKSTLKCTQCGHCSVTFDPFWDLSLPIPQKTGAIRLSQCLEAFTREETLDGDEKPTCSKCKERRKCTKSFSIHKFPKILVIHLKRFSPTERFRGKLSVSVDFPLEGLDMGPYAANADTSCRYNLYAVSNHSGTTYSGHYTAYCRHPYSASWHEYNDSRVSPISSKSIVSGEAYVLFYEQHETRAQQQTMAAHL